MTDDRFPQDITENFIPVVWENGEPAPQPWMTGEVSPGDIPTHVDGAEVIVGRVVLQWVAHFESGQSAEMWSHSSAPVWPHQSLNDPLVREDVALQLQDQIKQIDGSDRLLRVEVEGAFLRVTVRESGVDV